MFASEITPAQHYSIEVGAVRNEIIAHLFDVRVMNDLNPTLSQFRAVWWDISEIVRNKCNAMAQLAQNLKNMKHPDRSRISVGHGEMMVDHENAFSAQWRLG